MFILCQQKSLPFSQKFALQGYLLSGILKSEMKQAADHTTTSTPGGNVSFAAGIVGMTFLDTTWRIAVPVLVFAGVGIFADLKLGTKPWITLAAVVAGFVIAGWLVKKQIEAVEREERRKERKNG